MPDISSIVESSMLADLMRLEIISNNLANANTPGFRRDLAITQPFGDLLTGELAPGAAGPLDDPLLARTTRVTDQRPGSLRVTDAPLDLAIEGEGFLTLRGPEGPLYSRMGHLSLDATGRLVGAGGLAVLGTQGEIQLETSTPRIDRDGVIWDGDLQVGQLALVRFADTAALTRVAPGLWTGGAPLEGADAAPVHIRQGHLENSNVSVMQEMVQLIELMRRFEAGQQLLRGYDESLSQALRSIGDL